MLTRILILSCDYCHRTTRITGWYVTDDGLYRRAAERRWRVTPHPSKPDIYSPDARCPRHAKDDSLGEPWANEPGGA